MAAKKRAAKPGPAKRPQRPAASKPPAVGYSQRSRVDKLGVKPGHRLALLGVDDPAIRAELAERTSNVIEGRAPARADVVLLGVKALHDLDRLVALRERIAPDGMIWAIWTKGRAELKEDHVRRAALANGLVDVKVIAFSETLSGLKLVIPVAMRKR